MDGSLADARKNLFFVNCCFPEVMRTEQAGSVLFVPNSYEGSYTFARKHNLILPTVLMKPSSYLKVTVNISLIITLAHPENRRGSSYY